MREVEIPGLGQRVGETSVPVSQTGSSKHKLMKLASTKCTSNPPDPRWTARFWQDNFCRSSHSRKWLQSSEEKMDPRITGWCSIETKAGVWSCDAKRFERWV